MGGSHAVRTVATKPFRLAHNPTFHFPVTGARFDCLLPSNCGLPRIWEMEVEELALCVCEARTRHQQVVDIILRSAQVVALPCLQYPCWR
jgi:hypothetical protein